MANNFSDAVAAWLFAAGNLTVDSKGTNTLTAYGSIGSGTAIQGAASVAFDGASKYLGIADSSLATGFPFKNGDTGKLITVCFKIRCNTAGEMATVGKLSLFTAQSFGLTVSSNSSFEKDGGYQNNLGLPSFVNGHEYQIVYTIDGAGKTYSIYVHDYATGGYYFVNFTSPNAWTGSTLAFLIGRDAGRYYAYGEIGEIVVFNRILSLIEFMQIAGGTYNGPNTLIDFAPHDLTSDTSHSPFVVSSSAFYGSLPPWAAFNGAIGTYDYFSGTTGGVAWLALDIGSGNTKILQKYIIQFNHDTARLDSAPKNWTMEGSNDGSTWNTLDTVTNETSWSDSEARLYTCDTVTTPYRYFRLNITANNGHTGNTQVAEVYLYASPFYLYNFTTTIAAASAVSAPIAVISRPLASSPIAVSSVASPILAITRALQAAVAAGSAVSASLLAVLRALASSAAGVTAGSTSDLAVERSLSSSPAAISAVSTPSLAVQRALASLAAVMSETTDIDLLLHGILDITTAVAAQSQVSSPALNVARPLDSSIAAQAQTSAAALAVLRALVATIALEAQTPDIILKVLRDLATAISGQSAVSTPTLESICSLITEAHAVTDTSAAALAVLRDLVATIAAQSTLSDFGLAMGVPRDLITLVAALTYTSDIELILAFHESLLAKAKRYYGPVSAVDLKVAALQWVETEEDKEANLPGDQYNDHVF